mmetsp:Transcript_9744/g.10480  ORF Transcript_9744/g.10480 Transcript_9744/m.10480 type:complete len:270 (+) Transcript_9744:136-945(+)|eukprot:gene4795-5147_t
MSVMNRICFIFYLFFFHQTFSPFTSYFASACYLWGTDSGYCSTEPLDPIWKQENMPYCGKRIVYPTCLPKPQQLPPSREFPNGRWINFSVIEKDNWVAKEVEAHIQERISLEKNESLRAKLKNEYGDRGKIIRRLSRRPDCQNAYRNLFCYINFPRCDTERDLTLPTCRSACENFFKGCVYAKDLWRCGQSKYFNGYFPEEPKTSSDGNITYLREFFPGQPWRQNKYNKKGRELPVCTPAVLGGAPSNYLFNSLLSVLVLVVVILMTWI